MSFAPVVMFAEYTVFGVRVLVGVNVAEEPVWVTVPPIDDVPCFSVKVVPLRVAGSIGLLNVAVTFLLRTTPVAWLLPKFVTFSGRVRL